MSSRRNEAGSTPQEGQRVQVPVVRHDPSAHPLSPSSMPQDIGITAPTVPYFSRLFPSNISKDYDQLTHRTKPDQNQLHDYFPHEMHWSSLHCKRYSRLSKT